MPAYRLKNYLPSETITSLLSRASQQMAAEFNGAGWLMLSPAERDQLKKGV